MEVRYEQHCIPDAIEYYEKALSYENKIFTNSDYQDYLIETKLASIFYKLGNYKESQNILLPIYNNCKKN